MFWRKGFEEMHAWVEERLSDYIDNQLAPSERAQLDKHLRECDQCRASLESLRWTVSLVKQAPAVVMPRSFVLPVPARTQPTFVFGLARVGAVLATLLLFALIGIDLITQMGGGFAASAPAPAFAPQAASENSVATRAALVPQPTPTAPRLLAVPPTAAPQPTFPPQSSSAAAASSSASLAGAPAFVPSATATPIPERNGFSDSTATADVAPKSQLPTEAARLPSAAGAVTVTITPSPTWTLTPTRTATPIPPTLTATPVPPSPTTAPTHTATPIPPTAVLIPTVIAQAQKEATRVPISQPIIPAQPLASPLRLAEIGALFVAVFFGVLVILLRRR